MPPKHLSRDYISDMRFRFVNCCLVCIITRRRNYLLDPYLLPQWFYLFTRLYNLTNVH